jgi:hypothetical protein
LVVVAAKNSSYYLYILSLFQILYDYQMHLDQNPIILNLIQDIHLFNLENKLAHDVYRWFFRLITKRIIMNIYPHCFDDLNTKILLDFAMKYFFFYFKKLIFQQNSCYVKILIQILFVLIFIVVFFVLFINNFEELSLLKIL